MRDNIITMGLPEERLYAAMAKFEKIGGRTEDGRRNPWFQVRKRWISSVRNGGHVIRATVTTQFDLIYRL